MRSGECLDCKQNKIVPHKVGFCNSCGTQTMVRDRSGRPIAPHHLGVRVAFVRLKDSNGNVLTRVGHITLCSKCDPGKIDAEDILANICDTKTESVFRNTAEVVAAASSDIEVVKIYGE